MFQGFEGCLPKGLDFFFILCICDGKQLSSTMSYGRVKEKVYTC